MSYSHVEYTYVDQLSYSIPFEYLSKDTVHLYVNDIQMPDEDITWISDYLISVSTVLEVDDVIRLQRDSSITASIVDYQAGSVLTESNLDIANTQQLYLQQETRDLLLDQEVDPAHDHDERYYTEAEIEDRLSGVSLEVHYHDNLYYRKFELDFYLDSDYYDKVEMNTLLAGKSDTGHTHIIAWSSITNKPILEQPTQDGTFLDNTGHYSVPATSGNSDWNSTSGSSKILNRPDTFNGTGDPAAAGDLILLDANAKLPALDASNLTNIDMDQLVNIDATIVPGVDLVSGDANLYLNQTGVFSAAGSGGGENNVQADWTQTATGHDSYILHKPTLGTAALVNTESTLTASSNVPLSSAVLSTLANYYTETEADALFSLATHLHTGTYSAAGHNHDTAYSSISHAHATLYSAISHTHSGVYLEAHPNISAAVSSVNSGGTVIQDIVLDSNGHITGLIAHPLTIADLGLTSSTANINTVSSSSTAKNSHTHGDLYYTESEVDTLIAGVSASTHPTIPGANAETINNSNAYVIQDISTDANGHVTNIGSHELTLANLGVGATAGNIDTVSITNTSKNGHTHGDLYYTETEVDALFSTLGSAANKAFQLIITNTDLALPTSKAVIDYLGAYSLTSHTHTGTYLEAHPNIAGASSSDNSGTTFIQDLVFDSDGHTTGVTTSTLTLTSLGVTAPASMLNTVALTNNSKNGHTHDDHYYTETEIDNQFALLKSSTTKDFQTALTDVDTHLPTGSAVIDYLGSYYTKTEADARYSQLAHTHDTRYYTETEVDNLFSALGSAAHKAFQSAITNTDLALPTSGAVIDYLGSYYTKTEADAKYSLLTHDHDSDYLAKDALERVKADTAATSWEWKSGTSTVMTVEDDGHLWAKKFSFNEGSGLYLGGGNLYFYKHSTGTFHQIAFV